MSGTEILYVQNNVQVGVVGGWSLAGQTKIVNQSNGQTVQPVKITSPGDPLSFLPAPTTGTIVGKTHTNYDMNSKPPNNTISPGVYCGGLTIGNTNGATFTMSPGTYIMAGGGLTINSQGVVSGSGVTVYNTSSSSSNWGCSGSSSYTPITISGQANVTLSAPTSGAYANVLMFGDRAGCSTPGSCEDQINGGSSTNFTGALYFKTDNLLITGNNSSKGCMMAVADKITFNGNSSVVNACSGTIGGVTVAVSPSTTALYAAQTQQFAATVTNTGNTQVNWSISPAGLGTISASGLYTAPSTITTTQTVTVTATSQAEPTVSGTATITLAVPPSITASMSPSPNAAGWNNSTVTVSFACTAGTYAIKTCPSPVQVTTQGANQQFCGQAVDSNGGKSNTACVAVSLDETAPTITATPTPAADPLGWNNTDVTVNFTCSDSLSGISVCPSPILVSAAGANQVIKGTATDKAGNTATVSTTLNIELTLPSISAAVSPAPNSNYWNNTPVTVTFTCTASTAPITNCASPQNVSTQGANQVISGTVTDAANNTNTAKVTLNIATTPPKITASVSPAPNSNGWNDTAVTVTFTCTATTAPLATCPQPQTVNTPGANQTISGTVTDLAGNTASASVTLNIGTQPPTITGVAAPAPNSAGWNNTSVTVTWTCKAGTAPISSCPTPTTISTQGSNQIVTGTVTDVAGNSVSANVTVNIDETAPTITANVSPSPNSAGWNNSAVTVTFTCSDSLSGVVNCPSPQSVSTAGAGQVISGTVTDAAGNTASTQVTVNISLTSPLIVASVSPQPNSAGWNNSNVTVNFVCTPGGAPIVGCSAPQIVTTEGSSIPVTGTVTDAAGSSNTTTVVVKLDKTPPTITATVSPTPNSNGWNSSPVTVTFSCGDSLSGVATCPNASTITSSGANQTVTGTALDIAGNAASTSVTVNLEQTLPTISASLSPSPNSAGWNNTSVSVTFTCTPSVSSIVSCGPNQTVSSQGMAEGVTGTVVDTAGNQNTTSVSLNIDETPPLISAFTAPAQLSPGQSGSASLTVTDIAPVASVAFQLNGSSIGSAASPPYGITVTAPSNATSGSTLTLTAIVTDVAGNVATATKGIQVASSGVIVGDVLSDVTGLPLQGATLQVLGQSSGSATSDSQGRYSIPVTSSQLFLDISEPGTGGGMPSMVTVERQISVQSGVGTVPVDARMTPLTAPVVVTSSGGTVGSGSITITVPTGGATTSYYLTPLSAQGLPNLLPLGWSPLAAFDLQTNVSTTSALSANFAGLPTGALYLVAYSYSVHAWSLVTANLTASSSGALSVSLPSVGDYAIVIPDTGVTIPAAGQPLTGIAMVTLPSNATSTGSLSPSNVAPTGGTSTASLGVNSSSILPSGTVIQAQVTESYTLASGQQLSEQPRYEDLLLYQNPAPASGSIVGAAFPVTPSQTFQPSQLTSGDVHLNILSGRESVRGETGGSDPVSVQSGDATLTVAAGSLAQDTAVNVTPETVDTFLPSTATLVPVSEYYVDFSGQTLTNAAQLSVGTQGLTPGTNVVIAQEDRIAGVPYLVAVSMATVTTTNIVSTPAPGLPGITQGGEYVFYELTVPTGFVNGTVSASGGPVAAMVQTDALPFVSFSGSNGSYAVVAAAGTVNLTASIANTSLAGTTSAQVTSGQTATANISVAGQIEAATITPANGALGVSLTPEIDITAAAGFNTASATSSTVILTAAGSSTPIPLTFVFSSGNTRLAVFTQSSLQPSTQYTLQASGLANAVGGLISVPTTSFTTLSVTAPTYSLTSLSFAMPDSNGNVAVTAPAGSFPAGSTILIVDQTNGVVYSLTVFNDGSVTGSMPATISDILQVTLTDPSGNVSNLTVGQFTSSDGSVAVNAAGGTVTGPGGVSMIIPPGALSQGAVFQIQSLPQSAFPQLPSWTGSNFGGGMQITSSQMPNFNQEVKLAFPVPAAAPPGAFFYVYRQLTDQNNNVYFETLDHAFVQGTGASAQVVMASPPFCGYRSSFGNFQTVAGASFNPLGTAIVKTFFLWDFDPNQPGVASQGLIVGNIYQTVEANGQTTFAPYTGQATIQLTDPPYPLVNMAIWNQSCGTFTLFDPHLGGGPRNVTAYVNGVAYQATANEVNGIQVNDADYDVTAGLEAEYKNIGRVSFTVPPATPPPPPPQISIAILNANGNPASGIVQINSPLTITFSSSLTVNGATINGVQYSVTTDTPPTPVAPGAFHLSSNPFTPTTAGVYTITATGLPALGGAPVTATASFLAVQAGGSNNSTTTGVNPTFSAVPSSGTNGVPTTTLPQLTFSEPVTKVAGNVTLTDAENNTVPVLLIGIRRPNDPLGPIASPVGASDVITSLTVQPLIGLKFNETYTLSVWTSIVDLNSPPLPIQAPGTLNYAPVIFTTFGPQVLGATSDQFSSTRPVVINFNGWQRAYVGEYTNAALSALDIIDITNPALPNDEGPKTYFTGRAVDASGQSNSPVNGNRPIVAVAAGIGQVSMPSNIWIYDVSSPDSPVRLAGVSATTSAAQDGSLLRIFVSGQYIYASTYPKGLQMIDMAQAISDYNQTYTTNPTEFGSEITTDGGGFGLDAVINTVPIQLNVYQNGCVPNGSNSCTPEYDSNGNIITSPATMFDVKAATYALPEQGNVTNTEMVATGRLPLVVADPTQSLPGAILYPPQVTVGSVKDLSRQSLNSPTNGCGLPQNGVGQCSLQNGTALALTTANTTNSQGQTSSEPIAVVVGTGTATLGTSTSSGAPLLGIVNLSDPQNPVPQGFIQLSASPTDIVISGTTAIVATGSNVLLIDISNPSQPASVGQISGNFGNLLGLTASGYLVTTSPSSTNGGLQTAAFQPVVVTQCPGPILASVVSGAGSANPVYQTVASVTCNINVVPSNTPANNATFSLTQSNGSTVVPNSTVPLTNGAAQVTIPAGTKVTGTSANAQSTSVNTQTAAPIPSLVQNVGVGPVHVVVDSNNDTVIDPVADPAAASSGSKFSFWQADATLKGASAPNGGQDSLFDFAPVRIYVNALPTANQGSIQLGLLSSDGAVSSWVLTQNVGVPPGSSDTTAQQNEKLYLTNQTTATSQLALTSATAVTCGAATGLSFMGNLCASQAGLVELSNLSNQTMYELLISCNSCAQDSTWKLQVFLVASNGTRTVLDSVPVDFRPLANWMTIESVRFGSSPEPLSYPQLESGWMDIPQAAQNLVVLVHGFSVTDSNATSSFMPEWFKRLYWAGHPVLLAQNNTQTVGLSWPSNPGNTAYAVAYMSAFETGIPFGTFLSNQTTMYGRKIEVMAHSLGNVVVNSMLSRPESQSAQVTSYVMNEAALPAEAFSGSYQTNTYDVANFDSHAVSYGWSDNTVQTPLDQIWAGQWSSMQAGQPCNPKVACPDYTNLNNWNATLGASTFVTSPQPIYQLRWGQQRPSGIFPDSLPLNSTPARGEWLGFFAGNNSRTKVIDTYNVNDAILLQPWGYMNQNQQPYIGFLGLGSDNATVQYWAALTSTDGGQEAIWSPGQGCSTVAGCHHSNLIRQWAELSFWFPSRSGAAGANDLSAYGITSLNFTQYAPTTPSICLGNVGILTTIYYCGQSSGQATHSYMAGQPYPAVFQAWQQVNGVLK
ncbi:MAG TPA: Ig-like domain-containing protein [Candidatus Binatia bacterium]|nr:Ig-like domain-containing protein [Candidatus Binatia bacterium]